MAFKRYAHAILSKQDVHFDQWMEEIRKQHEGVVPRDYVGRIAKGVFRKCDPKQFLLSHATIVASVDTYAPKGAETGRKIINGIQVEVRWPEFRIKPECHEIINNNSDAWERSLLLSTYRTFIGAPNYLEHIQLPELSKGFIVDAIARDLGKTCYIDILVATDRRHRLLINDILSGQINAMSMGCISLFTTCTKCGNMAVDDSQLCFPPNTLILTEDGTYRNIDEIVSGDMVYTHLGEVKEVTKTTSRHYVGDLTKLSVEGIADSIRCTPEHPIWTLRPAQVCACGCGRPLNRTIEHKRGSVKSFQRRFLPGHDTRLNNPSCVNNIDIHSSMWGDSTFSFIEAKNIIPGDYLGFPIPNSVTDDDDATIDKARLIGYFLAEGCYIKRDGKRVGVNFSFGSHEHDTLAAETESLLNKVFSRSSRNVKPSWKELVLKGAIKPVRRNKNSRSIPEDAECPDCGAPHIYARNTKSRKDRDDCLKCKVCNRNWVHGLHTPVISRRRLSGTTSVVVLMDELAADFFYKYCGEYSNEKKLNKDVVFWSPDIQKHILFCWLNGDGSASKDGVKGHTSSFHLLSQMHLIAARCGLYSRKSVVFNGRGIEIKNVVNGDGSVTIRDERGWLPGFRLNITEPVEFTGETKFIDKENLSVKMRGFFNGLNRVGDYLVYRVKNKSTEPFHGDVHNFEVVDDHSYVVNGVAVHNCPCVLYEGKGTKFLDEDGVLHPIAELIGHVSVPDSNQFVEASWVRNPAFSGAARRNILNPDQEAVASQMQEAASIYELRQNIDELIGIKKAASTKIAQDEPPGGDAPPELSGEDDVKPLEPDAGDEAPLDDEKPPDIGDESDIGDEPDIGGDEKPPVSPEEEGKAKFNKLLEQAQEYLLKSIVKGLEDKMKPNPEDVGSVTIPNSMSNPEGLNRGNDNLIGSSIDFDRKLNTIFKNYQGIVKWATQARRIVRNGKRAIKASRMTPRDLIILSWIEDTVRFHGYPSGLYKVAMDVGPSKLYPSEASYLVACKVCLGRNLTAKERQFFSWKGRIASLSTQF